MTDQNLQQAVRAVFDGMRDVGPSKLLSKVNAWLDDVDESADEAAIIDAIVGADGNAPARKSAHTCLAQWDAVGEAHWTDDTPSKSEARRILVYTRLGIGADAGKSLNEQFPTIAQKDIVIENPGPWEPWYTQERRDAHRFYWDAYRGVLASNNWAPESIANLDESTNDIVRRLADPAGAQSYQSKGLVVGYVQSGKTANFTGIVAKAMDAGYRLVIVLTGTLELLRGQTQRRIDKELVGEENILGGRDRHDANAIRDVDYIGTGDDDWRDGKFLRHGVDISRRPDIPAIKRLTSASGDYKLLKAGLDTLDFRSSNELKDPTKPLFDPVNLFNTDIRLAVVKKNKSVLEKLLRDIHDVHTSLKEIPVLIIDDEADQASVNTTNPKRSKSKEEKDRTAINGLISRIISEMPRAQYIGYTATPFANVFVSPEDSQDIFPSDFIIALEPPPAYMGGKAFHDLDPLPEDETASAANSNEVAFVRNLKATTEEEERSEIRDALDAFVLSGAIKLWRGETVPGTEFRHHTMLVHSSVAQADHTELAGLIEDVWQTAEYSSPAGLARLRRLYRDDFARVHASRSEWDAGLPSSFDDLRSRHIGDAINLITAKGSPVVIVNGAKDSEYKAADFNSGRYWRVMVGGAKLSRGFTVEGLTISYYRRRAMAADTLMQMGRWFGYRKGYRDLVRLYIARNITDARGKNYDLYEAFTAIVQDEEAFRDQLRRFSGTDADGRPLVRPIDVPPLVFQQLPWLKPTGANKMYNAVLDFEGDGGQLKDFPRQAERTSTRNAKHFEAVRPWLANLSELIEFEYVESRAGDEPKTRTFQGRTALISAAEMIAALSEFEWTPNYSFEPTLEFMRRSILNDKLHDWMVLIPELKGVATTMIDGHELQLIKRSRRERGGFSGSSFRQRAAIERIAGNKKAPGGSEAARMSTPTRGAMLLTFAMDTAKTAPPLDPGDVATLFSLAMPYASAPRGRIGFRVLDHGRENEAIIDAS